MIEGDQVVSMVQHWLDTPPNSYFAQGYGSDIRSMLLRDLSQDNADKLIKKLRRDIPVLNQLSDSELSIQTQQQGFETLYVYLVVGTIRISLGESTPQTIDQDFYNVRAQ